MPVSLSEKVRILRQMYSLTLASQTGTFKERVTKTNRIIGSIAFDNYVRPAIYEKTNQFSNWIKGADNGSEKK